MSIDPQWVEAIGTLLAVITALGIAVFQDSLRSLFKRPRLEVSIELAPPDCHSIPIVKRNISTGETLLEADSYYLRLRIHNAGSEKAESVEVFAAGLLKRQADGEFRRVESFLPMNLTWAHYGRSIIFPAIVPRIYKHCDLGHIIDPDLRPQFDGEDKHWENVSPEKTILSLDTAVRPHTLSHLMSFGVYHLTIIAAAANAKPVRKTMEITLTGDWYKDEQKMLGEGIGVKFI